MAFTLIYAAVVAAFLATVVQADEKHTIRFDNRCGFGTPILVQGGKILSTGEDYTSKGVLSSATAYLQTGQCLLDGENCTLMGMTLRNPTTTGGGSSADISSMPPYGFSVSTSFSYFGGCDGIGATCSDEKCSTVFSKFGHSQDQLACQENNVNILITFCGDVTEGTPPFSAAAPLSNSASGNIVNTQSSFDRLSSVRPGRNTCGSRGKRPQAKVEWKDHLKNLAPHRLLRFHRQRHPKHLPAKLSAPTPVLPLSLPLPFRLPRQQERLAQALQVQIEPEAPC